jgi:Na+-driven multidrug efflux pump
MRALQPVVGINFGAEKYDRVISSFKVFAVASTILVFPFWLVMMISPEAVIHLMLPTAVLLRQDINNFRIFMSLLPLLPIMFMSMTFFPATNNGKPVAVIGIVRQLVLYVPVMLVLPRFWGVSWVYKGTVIIDLIITIWVFFMLTREFAVLRRTAEEVSLLKCQ